MKRIRSTSRLARLRRALRIAREEADWVIRARGFVLNAQFPESAEHWQEVADRHAALGFAAVQDFAAGR